MQLLKPITIKDMTVRNRIVLPPMCLYTAEEGLANSRHFVHYTSRAIGGTGLIIMEATAVMPNGRISDNCLGLWRDEQVKGLLEIVASCQKEGAKVALQLNHAGRKCTANGQNKSYTFAPSPIAFDETYRKPEEINPQQIADVVAAFAQSAKRASEAGFDAIEIHAAHGYLISSFLSPISNKRQDEYGGSTENRARFLLEVLTAVKAVWPAKKPLLLRVSATDYLEDGMSPQEMAKIVNLVKPYIDIAHVSSGGVVKAPINVFPGYQVPLAEGIKKACDIPVIAVGRIAKKEMVEEILGNNRADFVAIGKEQFRNPYWVTSAAWQAGQDYPWPDIYHEAYGRKK